MSENIYLLDMSTKHSKLLQASPTTTVFQGQSRRSPAANEDQWRQALCKFAKQEGIAGDSFQQPSVDNFICRLTMKTF